MTKKTWLIFAGLCVFLLASLIWLSQGDRVDVSNVDTKKIQEASESSGQIADHVFGKKDSKVVIIEYGDFQCPGCASAEPIMKEIMEKYEDKIAFVFRNYPLSIHPNARAAAAAAEAADFQDKYWEMHNVLYEQQDAWKDLGGTERTNQFVSYAEQLDLDTDKFLTDMQSTEIKNKINYDIALGKKDNVSSTPTIYVNDKLADSSVSDGKLVDANSTDPMVWSNVEDFENLMLIPAMKSAGITIDE